MNAWRSAPGFAAPVRRRGRLDSQWVRVIVSVGGQRRSKVNHQRARLARTRVALPVRDAAGGSRRRGPLLRQVHGHLQTAERDHLPRFFVGTTFTTTSKTPASATASPNGATGNTSDSLILPKLSGRMRTGSRTV